MSSKLTEVVFIIDNSGSMFHLVDDTIGGFNGFIEKQKAVEGDAYLTTVLFNTKHNTLHDHIDIREVEPMTDKEYRVGGGTALLDAIGDTIDAVQSRIDDTAVMKRPDGVICVIITDGEENSSTKFKKDQIKKMIEHQKKSHGWEFVFLGATMEAVQDARGLGISYETSTTYGATSIGTATAYNCVDKAVTSHRHTGSVDAMWCCDINESDAAYSTAKCATIACDDSLCGTVTSTACGTVCGTTIVQ